MPIRLVLADDHTMVRQAIRDLLRTDPEFDVVGEAGSGEEALERTRESRPDVLLLDIHMPGGDGLWTTSEVRREVPSTRVLVLTVSTEDDHLTESLRRGAAGYMLKSSSAQALFQAIRDVAQGETTVPGSMAARILAALGAQRERGGTGFGSPLSTREQGVLKLLSRGATNRDIAEALEISENTVKAHLKSVLRKLGVNNRVEAAGWALRHLDDDAVPGG